MFSSSAEFQKACEFVARLAENDSRLKAEIKKWGTPEKVLNNYTSVIRSAPILVDGIRYYRIASDKGYSQKICIDGAILATATSAYLRQGGSALAVVSGQVIKGGLIEIASGVGVFAGVTTTGIGAAGVALSGFAVENSNKIGEAVLNAHCEIAAEGGYLRVAKKSILGFLNRKNPKYIFFESIENVLNDREKFAEYQNELREWGKDKQFASEARILQDDLERQADVHKFFQEELGVDYADVDESTRSFFLWGSGSMLYHPDAAKWILRDDDGYFFYNPDEIDKRNQLGMKNQPKKAAAIHAFFTRHNGPISADGRSLVLPTYLERPAASSSDFLTKDIFFKVTNNLSDQLREMFNLNAQHLKTLNEVNSKLDVTMPDGRVIGIGEAFSLWFLEQHKKDLSQLDRQKRENQYKESKALASLFVVVGELIGSKSMQQYGHAGTGLVEMGFAIATGFSPTSVLSFFSGLTTFLNAINGEENISPFQVLFEQLKTLSKQIEDVKLLCIEGFLNLDNKLNDVIDHLLRGFSTAYAEIYINRLISSKTLAEIQKEIYQLGIQLNKQISALWMESLIDALFYIRNSKLRQIEFNDAHEKRYNKIVETLVHWLTEKAAHDNATGAYLYFEGCSSQHAATVIRSFAPEIDNIAGFLMLYAKDNLNVSLETRDYMLCNPNIWLMAMHGYFNILNPVYSQHRDVNCAELREVFLSGLRIINFYKALQSHPLLFPHLFQRYQTTLEKVADDVKNLVLMHNNSNVVDNFKVAKKIVKTEVQNFERQHFFDCSVTQEIEEYNRKAQHEYPSVGKRLGRWQREIAHRTEGAFSLLINDYYNKVIEENENFSQQSIDYQKPLSLFIRGRFHYLLPVSVLFTETNKAQITKGIDKLSELLTAEKLGMGRLVFVFKDQAYRVDNNNKAHYQIQLSFQDNKSTTPVAVIKLVSQAHYPAIGKIKSLVAIICKKYGKEICNPYTARAEETLARAIYVSGWYHAEIIAIENLYKPQPHLRAAVDKAMAVGSNDIMHVLYQDLIEGVPSNSESDQNYGTNFQHLKNSITEHDFSFQLLLTFAQLVGIPEYVFAKLTKLWNKKYILDCIKWLTVSTLTQSFWSMVQKHCDDTLPDEATKHPYSNSLSEAKEAVANVTGCNGYHCRNKLQSVIEAGLLVWHEQAQQLSLKLDADLLKQIAWPASSETTQLISTAYSADHISNLLQIILSGRHTVTLLPAYYPLTAEILEFIEENFIAQLRRTCFEENASSILLPLLFDQTVESIKRESWVLLTIKQDPIKPDQLLMYYIDPTGNEIETDEMVIDPLSLKLRVPNGIWQERFYAFIQLIQKAFSELTYSISLHVSGLRQIPEENWVDSGPLLIQNATAWITEQPFGISKVEETRQQHSDYLAGEDHPNLEVVHSSDQEFLNQCPPGHINGLGLTLNGNIIIRQGPSIFKILNRDSGECNLTLDFYAVVKRNKAGQLKSTFALTPQSNQFAILNNGQVVIKLAATLDNERPPIQTFLTLWDPETGEYGKLIPARFQITQLITLPDGQVATGSANVGIGPRGGPRGELSIWSSTLESSKQIAISNYSPYVTHLALLTGGGLIAAAEENNYGMWNSDRLITSHPPFDTGKIVVHNLSRIIALGVTPEGRVVIATCKNPATPAALQIQIFDAESWECEYSFELESRHIYTPFLILSDERLLLPGEESHIWNLKTKKYEQSIKDIDYSDRQSPCLMSLPNDLILSGTVNGAIKIKQIPKPVTRIHVVPTASSSTNTIYSPRFLAQRTDNLAQRTDSKGKEKEWDPQRKRR